MHVGKRQKALPWRQAQSWLGQARAFATARDGTRPQLLYGTHLTTCSFSVSVGLVIGQVFKLQARVDSLESALTIVTLCLLVLALRN